MRLLLTFCFLLLAPGAWAVPAIRFITPVDVAGTYTGTIQTYDTTAIKPSGMSVCGVLLRYRTTATVANPQIGFYHGDSTDTYTWRTYSGAAPNSWAHAVTGLNAAEEFKYTYSGGGGFSLWVIGFFDCAHITFLTNAVAYTPGTDPAYADVDISAHTTGTATGAFFHTDNPSTGTAASWAWRANGSTDNFATGRCSESNVNGCGLVLVKVDGAEVCEWKQSSGTLTDSVRLIGYVKSGVTFHDPALNKSTASVGTWQAVTGLSGVGAYVEMRHTANTVDIGQGVSTASATDDTYGLEGALLPSLVEITGGQIEQKIATASQDLYLRATFDAEVSPPTTGTRRKGQVY